MTIFCNQKLLLNILYEQKISYDCGFLRHDAVTKATDMWNNSLTGLKKDLEIGEEPQKKAENTNEDKESVEVSVDLDAERASQTNESLDEEGNLKKKVTFAAEGGEEEA